jgi:hypothetical protein
MKCPNCRKEIRDSAEFCGYCGEKIPKAPTQKPIMRKAAPPPVSTTQPASTSKPGKTFPWKWVAIAAVILVLVVVAVLLITNLTQNRSVPAVSSGSNSAGGQSQPSASDTISALGGTWIGNTGEFTITFTLNSPCQLNQVCGTFYINEWDLKGNVTFTSKANKRYPFKATNLSSGAASCATYEYLEFQSNTSLKYYSEGCEGGPSEATLTKH